MSQLPKDWRRPAFGHGRAFFENPSGQRSRRLQGRSVNARHQFLLLFVRLPSGTLMMIPLENGQSVAHIVGMSESGHRSCKCGAVYDRSEHIAEAREISSFECAVCGATIENWNSAWVPRYRFIACPARDAE
jgi:hypothetical protein